MEIYIPPPPMFIPRPPPRPIAPMVPIVAMPDMPEQVHAPEGSYTLNPTLFHTTGTPSYLTHDYRPPPMSVAPFMVNAAITIPAGQFNGYNAMSAGTTVVNGQTQPAYPVRFSWATVHYPAKTGEKTFGGLLGMGGASKGGAAAGSAAATNSGTLGDLPSISGYEASISSASSSGPSSDTPALPPTAYDVPLTTQQSGKRIFAKGGSVATLPRPKSNMRSNGSTLIMSVRPAEGLAKFFSERGKNGPETVRWGFWNVGRQISWGEEGHNMKSREPHYRIAFSQMPTCHTVSQHTASPDRMDLLIGFSTGDILWMDLTTLRYSRINKTRNDGSKSPINKTAVVSLQFSQRHPHHFIAAFADGTICEMNLFADDPSPVGPLPWISTFEAEEKEEKHSTKRDTTGDKLTLWKNDEFGVLGDPKKGIERPAWSGKNPMEVFRVGAKSINAIAYSPDGSHLAIVSDDGKLRLLDTVEKRITDTFLSYYAGLNCVAWSPDSRFVAMGGQDDLITIISPRESRVVARCEGHTGFVTAIAFDTSRGGGYRFASVGEDGKLILWDFTAAQLHRPRHHHSNSSHHRLAIGSSLSVNNHSSTGLDTDNLSRVHPAPRRGEVAILEPVMARMVQGNLLTGVYYSPMAIYTVSRSAQVKIWQRPPRQKSSGKRGHHKVSSSTLLKAEGVKSPRMEREAILA